MKPGNVIEVKNVEKKFKVYFDKGSQLKEKMLFWKRNRYEDRWVLKGVSFDVKRGEAIGMIGHNGCGKSTTLKLLSRIMYPDKGTIEMKGRVSSLLELGAGFHPDMSGRENIYTNASIFGLTKKEIDERLDDIIEFSELEEFLDNPVRTYSSGMYMRLAFSVAINVNADILLIDEILAVGDVNFQTKCFRKLREIKDQGTTIVIVSHSLGQIEQICDRTIWIHEGLIRADGTPRVVHPEYLDYMGLQRQIILDKEEEYEAGKEDKDKNKDKETEYNSMRWGNKNVEITSVATYTEDGEKKDVFATNESIVLRLDYKVNKPVERAVIGFGMTRVDGIACYGTNTTIDELEEFDIQEDGFCEITLKQIPLLPCVFYFDVSVQNIKGDDMDFWRQAHKIEIYSSVPDTGTTRLEHEWKLENTVKHVEKKEENE